MKNETFKRVIGELSSAYATEVPEPRQRQYYAAFSHFPDEVFSAAAERAKRECEFFPTIAKLHGFIKDYLELSGVLLSPELAWNRACAVIDAHFRQTTDPATLPYPNEACRIAVRSIGGEQRIADANQRAREFIRNEFVRTYDMVSMSAEVIGAIVNQVAAKRRYILLPKFRLAEDQVNPATGANVGKLLCWDTVELRPARMELYEVQQALLGDGDGATTGEGGIDRRSLSAVIGGDQ